MTRSLYISLIIAWLTFISPSWAVEPVLDIDKACVEMVPLYEAIPANETYVTSLVRRDSDGAIFGAACGKTRSRTSAGRTSISMRAWSGSGIGRILPANTGRG